MDGRGSRTLYCTAMSPGFDGRGLEARRSFPPLSLRGKATGLQILTSLRWGRTITTSLGGGISQLPKERQNGQTQGHYQRVGEGKKLKDIKFKPALIDFMKELLKPYWKRSKLSKNDHKIILKRAVGKVVDSVKASKIPEGEEVQEYLLSSKEKLSNFLQASVKYYIQKR